MPKAATVTIEKGTLFTSRGFLLLILTIYLIGIPVRENSDIFAAVVGFSLASWLTLIGITVGVIGFIASRKSSITIGSDSVMYYSQQPIRLFIHHDKLWTPPFSTVSFELYFDKSNFIISSEEHIIKRRDKQPIVLECAFPHRGVWVISCIRVILKDRFGVTSVAWQFLSNDLGAIKVSPTNELPTLQFPIVASQMTQGDDQIHMNNRLGDNFDIKPYHPSDGMRKIVWKVYAKSGQLVSRHPEATFTPEGKIAIFVIADKLDDKLCRTALNYAREIEEHGFDIFLSCCGASDEQIAEDSNKSEEILISTVWNSEIEQLSNSFSSFINRLRSVGQTSGSLSCAVFISEQQLRSEQNISQILSMFENYNLQGVSPIFFFVNESGKFVEHTTLDNVFNVFFNKSADKYQKNIELKERFYRNCIDNNWEIVNRDIA